MLPPKIKKQLKSQAHSLKPLILVGSHGLTEAVHKEIDRALNDHELIKIRAHLEDKNEKKSFFENIAQVNHAELIQIIGNIGVIYRQSEKKS